MSCLSTQEAYILGNVCAWNVPPDLAAVLKIPIGRFLFLCYVLVLFILVYSGSSTEKNDVTVVIYVKKNRLQVSALKGMLTVMSDMRSVQVCPFPCIPLEMSMLSFPSITKHTPPTVHNM